MSIIMDESGTLTSLLIVPGDMKDLFKLYPELVKAHGFSKVKVVIVDKALNEIAVIKSLMRDVTIQLRKFHVMQAFTREIKKTLTSR